MVRMIWKLLTGAKSVLSGLWGYLVVAGVVVAMIAAAFMRGVRAGADRVKTKQLEKTLEAKKRMDAVKPGSSDDVADSLRDGDF